METFDAMLLRQGPAFSGAGRLSMVGEQEPDPRASFGTLMEQQGPVFSGSLQPGRLSIVEGSGVKPETEPVVKTETKVRSGGGKAWVPTVTFLNFVSAKKKNDFKYSFRINYGQDTQKTIEINVNQVLKLGKEVFKTNPEAHRNGVGDHLQNIKNSSKHEQVQKNKISILYYLSSVLSYFYATNNVQVFIDLLTRAISSQGGGKRKRTKKRKTKKRTKKRKTHRRKTKKRTKRN